MWNRFMVEQLTACARPPAGDALVCGTSIASAGGMDRVRPLMGVCPQVRRTSTQLQVDTLQRMQRGDVNACQHHMPAPTDGRNGCPACGPCAHACHRILPSPTILSQFDVLWEQLTGREHLLLFGAIKGDSARAGRAAVGMGCTLALLLLLRAGACHSAARAGPGFMPLIATAQLHAGLPASERATEAARLLEDVKLTEASGVRAGSYSGGMKRRLSVAIALLGDPQVRSATSRCAALYPAGHLKPCLVRIAASGLGMFCTAAALWHISS